MHNTGILLKAIVIAGVLILAAWGIRQKDKSNLSRAAFALLAISGLGSGILGIYMELQHAQLGTPLVSKLGMIKSALSGLTIGIAAALLLTGQLTAKKSPNKSL